LKARNSTELLQLLNFERKLIQTNLKSCFSEINAAITSCGCGEIFRSYSEIDFRLNKKTFNGLSDKELKKFLSIVALTVEPTKDPNEIFFYRLLYTEVREKLLRRGNSQEEFLPTDIFVYKNFLIDKWYNNYEELLRWLHSRFGRTDSQKEQTLQEILKNDLIVVCIKFPKNPKRIQRHKGYRDKGSLGAENPNKFITDSIELKKEEEREEFLKLLRDTHQFIEGFSI